MGLEVPIAEEEIITSMGNNIAVRMQNMLAWMKALASDKWSSPIIAARINELQFLLYLFRSPLIPLQEALTAKYIVQLYIVVTGGQPTLNSGSSMCAMGQIKINVSEFHEGEESIRPKSIQETGGFVLWQKNPDLWSLEFVVSGCKVVCGSNGKLSWRHSVTSTVLTAIVNELSHYMEGDSDSPVD